MVACDIVPRGGAVLGAVFGGPERARAWWASVAARIEACAGPEDAMRELAGTIARDVDPYAFGIFLVDGATGELVLKHRFAHGPLSDRPIAVPPDQGLVGFVSRHGVPLVVHDVSQDPRYLRGPLADARSALVVPVLAGSGTVGALDIESSTPWTFDATDIEALTALASTLGNVLARTLPREAVGPVLQKH